MKNFTQTIKQTRHISSGHPPTRISRRAKLRMLERERGLVAQGAIKS